ncbi:hypothetical protein BT63DRAFT_475434 [Microthyrium microscopicum]|uniref:Uncharacterized protein n=1 Tax=Microthyrium microscopicum TaxID=703497 RepID=A0A6A6UMX1_9PEZI|nr:hypothetical protein BT63DRAFT_475434 [Microthyrium microscopicum]
MARGKKASITKKRTQPEDVSPTSSRSTKRAKGEPSPSQESPPADSEPCPFFNKEGETHILNRLKHTGQGHVPTGYNQVHVPTGYNGKKKTWNIQCCDACRRRHGLGEHDLALRPGVELQCTNHDSMAGVRQQLLKTGKLRFSQAENQKKTIEEKLEIWKTGVDRLHDPGVGNPDKHTWSPHKLNVVPHGFRCKECCELQKYQTSFKDPESRGSWVLYETCWTIQTDWLHRQCQKCQAMSPTTAIWGEMDSVEKCAADLAEAINLHCAANGEQYFAAYQYNICYIGQGGTWFKRSPHFNPGDLAIDQPGNKIFGSTSNQGSKDCWFKPNQGFQFFPVTLPLDWWTNRRYFQSGGKAKRAQARTNGKLALCLTLAGSRQIWTRCLAVYRVNESEEEPKGGRFKRDILQGNEEQVGTLYGRGDNLTAEGIAQSLLRQFKIILQQRYVKEISINREEEIVALEQHQILERRGNQ